LPKPDADPAGIPCPPSPDEEAFSQPPSSLSRGETMMTAKSTSLTSLGGLDTPLTSPSELTSPTSAVDVNSAKTNPQQMLAFQSDPSLPALLSGASSVSNDMESELLGQPGVVGTRTALLETTDSLTPPAPAKDGFPGFPLEQTLDTNTSLESGIIPLQFDAAQHAAQAAQAAQQSAAQAAAQAANQAGTTSSPRFRASAAAAEDDDSDDDSDDGLQMMKMSRKKKTADSTLSGSSQHRTLFTAKRRDTNASICSTETAKKVVVHADDATSPVPDQGGH
jgi:hypothetical protein